MRDICRFTVTCLVAALLTSCASLTVERRTYQGDDLVAIAERSSQYGHMTLENAAALLCYDNRYTTIVATPDSYDSHIVSEARTRTVSFRWRSVSDVYLRRNIVGGSRMINVGIFVKVPIDGRLRDIEIPFWSGKNSEHDNAVLAVLLLTKRLPAAEEKPVTVTPSGASATVDHATLEDRLRKLKQLRESDLIDEATYDRKASQLLEDL